MTIKVLKCHSSSDKKALKIMLTVDTNDERNKIHYLSNKRNEYARNIEEGEYKDNKYEGNILVRFTFDKIKQELGSGSEQSKRQESIIYKWDSLGMLLEGRTECVRVNGVLSTRKVLGILDILDVLESNKVINKELRNVIESEIKEIHAEKERQIEKTKEKEKQEKQEKVQRAADMEKQYNAELQRKQDEQAEWERERDEKAEQEREQKRERDNWCKDDEELKKGEGYTFTCNKGATALLSLEPFKDATALPSLDALKLLPEVFKGLGNFSGAQDKCTDCNLTRAIVKDQGATAKDQGATAQHQGAPERHQGATAQR